MFAKFKSVIGILCASALMLIAAGCSSNPDPTESSGQSLSPTTTSSGSPSTPPPSATVEPTPTPVPASSKGPAKNWPVPKLPEAAKEKSKEGIAAFTKYYFELVDYTVLTYDTKPIKAVTEHSCYLCAKQIIDPGDSNRGQGNWHVGGKTVISVNFVKLVDSIGISGFTFERERTSIYLPNGDLQSEIPATKSSQPGTLHLSYAKGWKVVDVEFVDIKGK